MQLVLDTSGLTLSAQRHMFVIEASDGKKRSISPERITSIAITRHCTLSSKAVELAATHEIPIYFLNAIGKVVARMDAPNFQSIASLRRWQVSFTESPSATTWMVALYQLKTSAQMENLKQIKAPEPVVRSVYAVLQQLEMLSERPLSEAASHILQTEAYIARLYWKALAQALPTNLTFQTRNRRPAQDPFNAALNYLYGMLYTVVETALFAAGLDPHLGIMHADEYNKPVLAFDFIEPFRPWADKLLLEQCLADKVIASHFLKIPNGLVLSKAGKAFLIPLFNDWLHTERIWKQHKTTVRNHIYQLAGKFAAHLRAWADRLNSEE